VENLYSCTVVEGEKSTCTPITCGNGLLSAGEECDDGNFVDNDGCSKCLVDQGYKCPTVGAACVKACGDGQILRQVRASTSEVVY
jgi:cysteine-rich repeat protein